MDLKSPLGVLPLSKFMVSKQDLSGLSIHGPNPVGMKSGIYALLAEPKPKE